jgi:hypothetical protein
MSTINKTLADQDHPEKVSNVLLNGGQSLCIPATHPRYNSPANVASGLTVKTDIPDLKEKIIRIIK